MRAVRGICCRMVLCVLAGAIALLLGAGSASASDCPFADAQPGQATLDQVDAATVCLLNQQRAAAGLAPLAVSAPLADTATRYAGYMVARQHFAHIDLEGRDVVGRVTAAYPSLIDSWSVLGENLGWGSGTLSTPRVIVNLWMGSQEHRANVLAPSYDSVGIGTYDGAPAPASDARTFVVVFGDQAGSTTATARARAAAHRRHRRHRRHRQHRRASGTATVRLTS